MASALRLSSAFRAATPLRTTAFNGLRFYSSKTTVGPLQPSLKPMHLLTHPIAVAEGDLRQQAARRDREDQEAPQVRFCQSRIHPTTRLTS